MRGRATERVGGARSRREWKGEGCGAKNRNAGAAPGVSGAEDGAQGAGLQVSGHPAPARGTAPAVCAGTAPSFIFVVVAHWFYF